METYFVEPELQAIKNDLKTELQKISSSILARNLAVGLYASYDSLNPERVPNSKFRISIMLFLPLPRRLCFYQRLFVRLFFCPSVYSYE